MTDIPYGYCHCGCGEKTKLATQTWAKHGWIKGQPLKYILHHMTHERKMPIEDRFWSKVNIGDPDECWEWQAARTRLGYGAFSVRHATARPAHIIAYELICGEITNGLEVCHTCDNPPCCNPNHLFLGTHKENMEDMANKGRSVSGIKSHLSRHSEDSIIKVRELFDSGIGITDISRQTGIPVVTVWNVSHRKTWKHI